MRISDWSSDVCSSDLVIEFGVAHLTQQLLRVSGANEPLVDQRDAVGMECDASDRGDRPVKMGLDPPEQGTFPDIGLVRSEEHTSELQSLMRISYAVFCLKKKTSQTTLCYRYYTWNQQLV